MNYFTVEKISTLMAKLKEIDLFSYEYLGCVIAPRDKLIRIPLYSAQLREVVAGQRKSKALTNLPDYRMRLALPYTRDSVMLADKSQFELYGVSYEPALKPIKLVELGDELAQALECELLQKLRPRIM